MSCFKDDFCSCIFITVFHSLRLSSLRLSGNLPCTMQEVNTLRVPHIIQWIMLKQGSWNVSRTSPLGIFYEEHANLFVIHCRDHASVVVQVVQVSHGWWKETEVNEHRNYHLTDHVPQKNKTQQTNSHLWFNNHWEQLEIKNSSSYEHPSVTWMKSSIIKRSYHVSHNSTLKSKPSNPSWENLGNPRCLGQ